MYVQCNVPQMLITRKVILEVIGNGVWKWDLSEAKGLEKVKQTMAFVACEEKEGDWRSGSIVKSIGCSSRGPLFDSQHPRGVL